MQSNGPKCRLQSKLQTASYKPKCAKFKLHYSKGQIANCKRPTQKLKLKVQTANRKVRKKYKLKVCMRTRNVPQPGS